MMKRNHVHVGVLMSLIWLLAACGGGAAEPAAPVASEPSVRFLLPRDGSTVSSPVQVQMDAINYDIEEAGEVKEGSGHFHIMVNEDCVTAGEIIPSIDDHNHYGKAQTEAELELEPGEYTLCLQVGDGLHTATELVDVINITVE